jgi:hypothetical protein
MCENEIDESLLIILERLFEIKSFNSQFYKYDNKK